MNISNKRKRLSKLKPGINYNTFRIPIGDGTDHIICGEGFYKLYNKAIEGYCNEYIKQEEKKI